MHSKFNPVFYRLMKQGYTHYVTHQQDKKWFPFVEGDNRKINAGKFSKEIKRCSGETDMENRLMDIGRGGEERRG